MQFTLTLQDSNLPEDRVQALTRDLCLDLNKETPLQAVLPEDSPVSGARSESAMTVGAILVTLGFHTAGAMAAHAIKDGATHIAHKLATYFERNPTLRMEVALPDGRSLALVESNVRPDRMDDTVMRLKELLEAAK